MTTTVDQTTGAQGKEPLATLSRHRKVNGKVLFGQNTIPEKREMLHVGGIVGDSGYFRGIAEIGRKLGPFDLALLPTGGHDPRELLKPLHMNPADAVHAFYGLRGKRMLAIHGCRPSNPTSR